MVLEDFLHRHPGWQVEQHPFRPQYRAVSEERSGCAVPADTIDELDAKLEQCAAKAAA